MSEQTKYSAALRAGPNQSKKPSNVAAFAFAADPQQALAVTVDLIDQRQVALPAAAGELVDADGLDVREVAVREAPVDRHAHGPIDGVPGRGERRGDLLPRQTLGPPGEEPGVGVGQSVLAGGPRQRLDPYAAARAVDAAHRVEEDHGDVPQGHEVEAPDRLRVVARGPAPALRARRAGPGARPHPNLEGQLRVLQQPHRLVDERRVLLDPIQDTLELHPVPLPRRLAAATPIVADSGTGCVPMSRLRSVLRDGPSPSRYGRREFGPRQTRAGALVRGAGVQAVSPAQRGRSGAKRLDGGEHTGTLGV